ncbi:hypothetical protein IE53DRAFT_386943 [Violaceomyces palustris]|uniref:Uncharacterized protein n=1 Tax=Violaceomyces palustris TaxID=1673888 RepID=A0ACD0NYA5_9BASI|nr:hypothetical protein IE53DRAFT_386943 [Violaceomyces palustris]
MVGARKRVLPSPLGLTSCVWVGTGHTTFSHESQASAIRLPPSCRPAEQSINQPLLPLWVSVLALRSIHPWASTPSREAFGW